MRCVVYGDTVGDQEDSESIEGEEIVLVSSKAPSRLCIVDGAICLNDHHTRVPLLECKTIRLAGTPSALHTQFK